MHLVMHASCRLLRNGKRKERRTMVISIQGRLHVQTWLALRFNLISSARIHHLLLAVSFRSAWSVVGHFHPRFFRGLAPIASGSSCHTFAAPFLSLPPTLRPLCQVRSTPLDPTSMHVTPHAVDGFYPQASDGRRSNQRSITISISYSQYR